MSTYILYGTDGGIAMCCSQPFDGCIKIDCDVVAGWDGKLYKAGEVPAPPLAEVQAAKRDEVDAGFEAALIASLTMPSRDTPPSVVELAIAIADFKADDPAGLTDLQSIHEARRASLLAAVDAATSVDAVQAITVSYAV